jgi:hypothetical protein
LFRDFSWHFTEPTFIEMEMVIKFIRITWKIVQLETKILSIFDLYPFFFKKKGVILPNKGFNFAIEVAFAKKP